ncbi:leucine-rich repeat domain-containing protein [Niallia sp. Man26]|uniref:leucine-rich repeat domain-containing protein n=1 Tax=Niallia sp. Man26 TaxID=2912824 RepID=UPI001EDB621E|nr:leucine-rich repeat domain-containing protein [Niallia sp. Man26]UPO90161.1 protein phosphatase 1 regulatory subunit 42 [Niallia sp. Man26]
MLLFPTGKQPKFIKDLKDIIEAPKEIALKGNTQHLEYLSNFAEIEIVWIYSVNQKEFDLIINSINPKTLYIYEMRVEDLSSIERLKDLEQLYLCWNPKANKLWDMSKNPNLKHLSIEDFKRLNHIDQLESCYLLQELNLAGGIWTTLNIDTLEPIKQLQNLKVLGLSNLKVKDNSLEPISHLKGLMELNLSNQFSTEEFAMLSVKLPKTKCEYFHPYVKLKDVPTDEKDIMVIGKRKPFLNSTKDIKKLQKYEKQFKEFQKKYLIT